MEDIIQQKNIFVYTFRKICGKIIRKVASPYVHFASQICTAQGNLTLLYTEKS